MKRYFTIKINNKFDYLISKLFRGLTNSYFYIPSLGKKFGQCYLQIDFILANCPNSNAIVK